MKNLIIIGARGYGREICSMAPNCIGFGDSFSVKGFLDSESHSLAAFTGYPPILDSPENYIPMEGDVFICAMGDVGWRKKYVELMAAKGAEFITLIHKGADIGASVKIGKGCFIRNNVVLTTDIAVGDHVSLFDSAMVGHDCIIGDYCHLAAMTFMGGGVELGRLVTLHPGSRIVPHKKIGDGATVGIGSVVLNNIKRNVTVFGVPALPMES